MHKYLKYLRCFSHLKAIKFDHFKILTRSSALFINGPKATDNFVYIIPHIDFPDRITQREILLADLSKREAKIDLEKLENLWSIYEDLKSRKIALDKKKEELSSEIEILLKEQTDNDKVQKLKMQISLVKENIKKLKAPLWSAEEAAVIEALKLPNKLHSLTPERDRTIIYKCNSMPLNDKSHVKIGQEKNLIQIDNSKNYYLKGDAAIFELGASFHFSDILKQNNFIQFSNTDFSKSLVVEGCGIDYTDPNCTFKLHQNDDNGTENQLHLTGAGSLYSFFAYHSKNVLYSKVLPLKYFAIGRKYLPSIEPDKSLFNTYQKSVVELFVAARNDLEVNELLNNVIDIIKSIYNQFGYHYRLSYTPAYQLSSSESLRLSIEMYSNSLKNYVEVGNISISGDYISKRLMFTYMDGKQSNFPHIISGTILNVPNFLACILEQDNDFIVPEQFRVEKWKINNT